MREYDFTKYMDVIAICRYDLYNFLAENPHVISESIHNTNEYKKFIEREKSHTIDINDLVKNKAYAVVFLHALPSASYMRIGVTPSDTIFRGVEGNKLRFKTKSGHNIMFPTENRDTHNSYADTLIFNSVPEQKQFMSLLKSTYSDWTINTLRM